MATSRAVQAWASAELHLVVLTHFPLTAEGRKRGETEEEERQRGDGLIAFI